MGYGIRHSEDVLRCGDKPADVHHRFDYEQGKQVADVVGDYLKGHDAILVSGPDPVSGKVFEYVNNAGEWVYNVKDSTLQFIIRRAGNRKKMDIILWSYNLFYFINIYHNGSSWNEWLLFVFSSYNYHRHWIWSNNSKYVFLNRRYCF